MDDPVELTGFCPNLRYRVRTLFAQLSAGSCPRLDGWASNMNVPAPQISLIFHAWVGGAWETRFRRSLCDSIRPQEIAFLSSSADLGLMSSSKRGCPRMIRTRLADPPMHSIAFSCYLATLPFGSATLCAASSDCMFVVGMATRTVTTVSWPARTRRHTKRFKLGSRNSRRTYLRTWIW